VLSTTASLAERLSQEPELSRLISAILDPQLPDGTRERFRETLQEMVRLKAWTHKDRNGDIYLVQAHTKEHAIAMLQQRSGHTTVRANRCSAMDNLGYVELHGIYSGVVDAAQCQEFDNCGTYVEVWNSHIVNCDTGEEAIVVDNKLYCSRFCATQAR
jgi:hypothetical protein